MRFKQILSLLLSCFFLFSMNGCDALGLSNDDDEDLLLLFTYHNKPLARRPIRSVQ